MKNVWMSQDMAQDDEKLVLEKKGIGEAWL